MDDLLTRGPRARRTRSLTAGVLHSLPVRLSTAPFLVGLIGLTISLTGITIPSLWYDEAASVSSATRSLPELWGMVQSVDAVHAAYYAILHLVFDLFGYSPLALRAPSAVAVGVAAAFTVALGRQLRSTRFGVIAGLVFCLLPRTTWMGTEGRSYAAAAALAVIATVLLVGAVRSPAPRLWWIGYSGVVAISGLVFVYLALIVIAHGVSLAWWRLAAGRIGARGDGSATGGRETWRTDAVDIESAAHALRAWLLAAGAAAAVLTPFALGVVSQTGQLHWIDPIGPSTARQVFQTQWFYRSIEFAVAGWALIALGVAALLRSQRGQHSTRLLLPQLILPTALLLIATAVSTPLYTPRYLAMSLPFVAVIIAAGIRALPTRTVPTLVLLSLVVLAIPQIIVQRTPSTKEDTTWNSVAELIASERAQLAPADTTAIVWGWVRYHPSATARVIEYSYPAPFEGTVDVTLDTPAARTGQLWETRHPLADSLDRLGDADVTYLITSVTRDLRPETTETLATVGWAPEESWNLGDVNVVRYRRD